MAISSALSTQLRQLAASIDMDSIDVDSDALHDALTALVTYVQQAVPSYRGLRVRLLDHGWPVTLTAMRGADDVPIATSLRVSLQALTGDADLGHITFYAATPGAMVDLAADLGYALGATVTTPERRRSATEENAAAEMAETPGGGSPGGSRRPQVELDGEPWPTDAVSGPEGLAELTMINRAVGVLIDQGRLVHDAQETIRRGAAAIGVAPHLYAARFLP